MGLAASQARLLTITARLADNELRSQTINNAKMRLATQSAQASDEYVTALNNAQLMFANTSDNGLSQQQALTFNSLTQYSQYNNQYGLVNSGGQILVSEKEAEIFNDNKNNLEGFLKAHNIEWDTTYFDQEGLKDKLTSFYGTDPVNDYYGYIGQLFNHMGDTSLKDLYLEATSEDASIEKLNYDKVTTDYYNAIISMSRELYPQFRSEIMGTGTDQVNEAALYEAIGNLSTIEELQYELIAGDYLAIIDDSIDGGGKFAMHNVSKYLNSDSEDYIRAMLFGIMTTNMDGTDYYGVAQPLSTDVTSLEGTYTGISTTSIPNIKLEEQPYNTGAKQYKFGDFIIQVGVDILSPVQSYDYPDPNGNTENDIAFTYQTILEQNQTIIYYNPSNSSGHSTTSYNYSASYNGQTIDSSGLKLGNVPFDLSDPSSVENILSNIVVDYTKTQNRTETPTTVAEGKIYFNYTNRYPGSTDPNDYSICKVEIPKDSANEKNEFFKTVAKEYFSMVFDNIDNFNSTAFDAREGNTSPYFTSLADDLAFYGLSMLPVTDSDLIDLSACDNSVLIDYDKLLHDTVSIDDGKVNLPIALDSDKLTPAMRSVLATYMVERMVDILGEPKFCWVDKSSNPTDNPDSKAQWYTNLFNRMQKGYKVLENGLASSKEWIEYALESGLVTMEQVDMSYNWTNLDYKSCANIFEETDNSTAVAKAEAKYNRAMNDIKQKDSFYDLQLKNIDTEHSTLQTEYDVIKNVISKNIERTMKFDQSA